MNRIEVLNTLLAKVDEDKRAALVEKLRTANNEERIEILKAEGLSLTKEEKEKLFQKGENMTISDEELDLASGGCMTPYCGTECCD